MPRLEVADTLARALLRLEIAHVRWMHPGKLEIEQVAKQSMAGADVGPRDVRGNIRTELIQAILPLTL